LVLEFISLTVVDLRFFVLYTGLKVSAY